MSARREHASNGRSATSEGGASPRLAHAWTLLACLITLPAAGWAVCGGGTVSNLPSPTVTYLRSYRASFSVPARLAADAAGNVYVTDTGQGHVVVRAPNGRIVSRRSGLGRPASVAVDASGRIYVGDRDSGSVTAFSPDWQPILQLGHGAGEFLLPNDLAVDATTGNVYVADSPAHLVKVYSAAGVFLQSFGGQGSGDGQFNFPVSVVVDAAARQVLVVDQLNYRVQVFDVAGGFLSCFGTQGSDPGQFNMPQGVSVDNHGRVYVADAIEGRIQVLDHSGGFIAYIGDFGEAAGQLRIPTGMVIDPSNRLFIAAANNARLEVFGLDSFADPETVLPAVVRMEAQRIELTAHDTKLAGYIEVPGYALDQIKPGSITANGVSAIALPVVVHDHDGDGVPEMRVEFDRSALLATLPVDGSGTVAFSGMLGTQQLEGSAAVQISTCGPDAVCSLGDADPQCNDAVCTAGVGCAIQTKPDGTGCEDGNACTIGDVCRNGACTGAALSCNDGNVCTDDSCDPVSGCVNADNSASCDDANACTINDICSAGSCTGTPLSCDDGNVCTDDACDPANGCAHADNTLPCDDGNLCTGSDICAGGHCGGAAFDCDDGNVCTDDTCVPLSGCIHTNNALPCNDGNACTALDTCTAGLCTGAPLGCDDGNVCTDDACDPGKGCVHTGNTVACNDGDPGTVHDACDGVGKCVGQAVTGHYALLRWPLKSTGHRAASLSGQAAIRGNVCAENIRIGPLSQIDGDAVAWASSGWAMTFRGSSRIAGDVVSAGGTLLGIDQVTVGGRVALGGQTTALTECFAARSRAARRRADFVVLPATPGFALGAIHLENGATRRIPSAGDVGSGQRVIDITNLRLDSASTLTLVGTAATQATIVRIHGRMMLGRAAQIVLEGIPAERVIFVIDGSVLLQSQASVAGSVFAAGRVHMGSASTITGALLGAAIDLAPSATVELRAFSSW